MRGERQEKKAGETERQDVETKGTIDRGKQKETERGRKVDRETERAGGKARQREKRRRGRESLGLH